MDRRDFLKGSLAGITFAGAGVGAILAEPKKANAKQILQTNKDFKTEDTEAELNSPSIPNSIFLCEPVLQNYASTSINIAFGVTKNASAKVEIWEADDISTKRTIKCGGYRVTDMNDSAMLITVTNLKQSTEYVYKLFATEIIFNGGYDMHEGETFELGPYKFKTAGKNSGSHFCVINDTHYKKDSISTIYKFVESKNPDFVLMNGDIANREESLSSVVTVFLNPAIDNKGFAKETPHLLNPGNHEQRGKGCRQLERVWMFRPREERLPEHWDLGRNFAVRSGDIALIGMDTGEDKLDTNHLFAGLFNNGPYRELQAQWLANALQKEEIKSAPFLICTCHIPLFDSDPTANPGDLYPDDTAPGYPDNAAVWQRTCANLWMPLLEKQSCQLVISAHRHNYRFDEPTKNRPWAQIVGGGSELSTEKGHATVMDIYTNNNKLIVDVINPLNNELIGHHEFNRRY